MVLGLAWALLCLPPGLSFAGVSSATPKSTGATNGHGLIGTIAAVAHTFMADHPPNEVAWSWGEGVLLLGLQHAAGATGDPGIEAYVRAYYDHHRTHGIAVTWSDDTTPGIAAMERVLAGQQALLPLAEPVVRYIMTAPRSANRGLLLHLGNTRLPLAQRIFPEAWVDSLFHVVPTLVRYSEWQGDPRYRDEALRQLRGFVAALQDPETGFVTHAYNDLPRDERVPPLGDRAFWARGNGWMLVALVDALTHTPDSHPDHPPLLAAARRLAVALRDVQTESGLFHTLLLAEDSYLEAAGSALIVYGLESGARQGLWPPADARTRARDLSGLSAIVQQQGTRALVTGTSLGTNPIKALYAITPTADQVTYGVGAWLLAACEVASSHR